MIADELFQRIGRIDFTQIDLDKALDNRDLPEFDDEWVRVFEELETIKKEEGFSEENKKISDNIREKVYLKVYGMTQDDDIAAYISDDFGLICDSELLNYKDELLEKFIKCYHNSQFPYGEL